VRRDLNNGMDTIQHPSKAEGHCEMVILHANIYTYIYEHFHETNAASELSRLVCKFSRITCTKLYSSIIESFHYLRVTAYLLTNKETHIILLSRRKIR